MIYAPHTICNARHYCFGIITAVNICMQGVNMVNTFHITTLCPRKKDAILLPRTSQYAIRFSRFFHWQTQKFVVTGSATISLHLKCVTTLFCDVTAKCTQITSSHLLMVSGDWTKFSKASFININGTL